MASVVSLVGPAGIGKSTLVQLLAPAVGEQCDIVVCTEGDTESTVRARCERLLRCGRGALSQAIEQTNRLLVIDQMDRISPDEGLRIAAGFALSTTAQGRVLLIGREPLGATRDVVTVEHTLGGLADDDAATLWQSISAVVGEVSLDFAEAMETAGGHPERLRRMFTEASAVGAWDLSTLGDDCLQVLCTMALVRWPVTQAGMAAIAGLSDPSTHVAELASRLLISQAPDGGWHLSNTVCELALGAIDDSRRQAIARRACALLTEPSGDRIGMPGVDRCLALTRCARTAQDPAVAKQATRYVLGVAATRGAGTELDSALSALEGISGELAPQRLELALRSGRFAFAEQLINRRAIAPVSAAELALAAGDLDRAESLLREAVIGDSVTRARATTLQVRIALLRGRTTSASEALFHLTDTDASESSESAESLEVGEREANALCLLAQAQLAEYCEGAPAARALLQRAAAQGGGTASTSAAAQAARCLALEGDLPAAVQALDAAWRYAAQLDAPGLHLEIAAVRAELAAQQGDTELAVSLLRDVIRERRYHGDEIGALEGDLALADVFLTRGQATAAAELANLVQHAAVRRHADHLKARADLILAAVHMIEVRNESAYSLLKRIRTSGSLDTRRAAVAEAMFGAVTANLGQRNGALERTVNERAAASLWVAATVGELSASLELAQQVAAEANLLGRRSELASALALIARIEIARGDRTRARAAAVRAVREATSAGLRRARVHALLALCALSRDEGKTDAAAIYAGDAAELAAEAGLPVERLAAFAALDGIAGNASAADPGSPAAATMTTAAIEAAARLLADLGLTARRPFRVVDAEGETNDITDASPDILRLSGRALAVDGVRETIWRSGHESADLRRRSLLKRLLFLFASQPTKILSKEEIVRAVWNVEYHPLRHDAALFTNIMRIRRLLGEDGADLIRVSEDGYRFVPPRDFVFVLPRM